MNLLGANPQARLVAEDSQQGKVNYFLGKDPSKWISNVPLYGRVNYKNVYPGVDLAFHGAGQQLEFDYLVSPGADASRIALSFQGADSLHTDTAGNLVLATSAGPLQLQQARSVSIEKWRAGIGGCEVRSNGQEPDHLRTWLLRSQPRIGNRPELRFTPHISAATARITPAASRWTPLGCLRSRSNRFHNYTRQIQQPQ